MAGAELVRAGEKGPRGSASCPYGRGEEAISATIASSRSRSRLDFVDRRKLTPMVHGFFPEAEREAVLRLFEKSVVFLTSDNIENVLLRQRWLWSAWDLANLYLSSVQADLL